MRYLKFCYYLGRGARVWPRRRHERRRRWKCFSPKRLRKQKMVSNKIIAVLAGSERPCALRRYVGQRRPYRQGRAGADRKLAAPDVDPGASKGPDKPIVKQEKNQLDNSMSTDVPEPSMKGGELIRLRRKRASSRRVRLQAFNLAEHPSHRCPVDRVWLISVRLIQRWFSRDVGAMRFHARSAVHSTGRRPPISSRCRLWVTACRIYPAATATKFSLSGISRHGARRRRRSDECPLLYSCR